MALFNFKKKEEQEVEEQPQRQTNPGMMLMVRLVAVGYILWTLKDLIAAYMKGGEDAPSLTLVICAAVVFIGGCAWIAVASWKQYKRLQEEQAAAAEEAARLEAEEKARLEAAEDEDFIEEETQEISEEV